MMLFALFLLLSGDFWDKPPSEWSQAQLIQMLTDSPWAQMAGAPGVSGAAGPVQVMIATARPIELAEAEAKRRTPAAKKEADADDMKQEYLHWLQDNRSTQIVVAVAAHLSGAYSDEREMQTMQNECVMRIGRKKYKMTGYFPPSKDDPYLRLAFPREVKETDKSVSFDLYIPGIGIGYRSVEFSVKDMTVDGKLVM